MIKSIKIADYFINKYGSNGNITLMKLIKLVYIAHGWHLGLTGEPLLGENAEAWKYGPVIPSVYHCYKHNGSNPIKECVNDFEAEDYFAPLYEGSKNELLDKIWEVYGNYSGIDLSEMTHQEGTPWYKTLNDEEGFTQQISDFLIKDYYSGLSETNREEAVTSKKEI